MLNGISGISQACPHASDIPHASSFGATSLKLALMLKPGCILSSNPNAHLDRPLFRIFLVFVY